MSLAKPETQYFKHLDGVRTLAVLMVIVSHWTDRQTPSLLHYGGAMGVGLFFVLSGFLISNILLKQQVDFQSGVKGIRAKILTTFYIRRTLRIFPIYYLYITVLVVLGIGASREIWPWLYGYAYNFLLYFTNNWYSGYVEHLWSLAIEEQFYLIWPIALLACPPRYNLHLVVGFIALGLICKSAMYLQTPDSQYSKFPVCQFDAFGLGALLALIRRSEIKIPYPVLLMWLSFALYVFFKWNVLHFHGKSFLGVIFPWWSLFSMLLVHQAADGIKGISRHFFDNEFVIYLGKISYGLYLYHLFVPDFTGYVLGKIGVAEFPFPIMHLIYSLVTLGICAASWRFIEQPINGLKDRFSYSAKK